MGINRAFLLVLLVGAAALVFYAVWLGQSGEEANEQQVYEGYNAWGIALALGLLVLVYFRFHAIPHPRTQPKRKRR